MNLIENYIYFYHLDKVCILPLYPESVSESISANFNTTSILGRSAPLFTYANSGPRTQTISIDLHREMLYGVNITNSTFIENINTDTVIEELIKTMQAAVLPKYTNITKTINPPIVAMRLGDELFIKGIIRNVSTTFRKPIVNNKYQLCTISFTIEEFEPYDAEAVKTIGFYRGFDRRIESDHTRRYNQLW